MPIEDRQAPSAQDVGTNPSQQAVEEEKEAVPVEDHQAPPAQTVTNTSSRQSGADSRIRRSAGSRVRRGIQRRNYFNNATRRSNVAEQQHRRRIEPVFRNTTSAVGPAINSSTMVRPATISSVGGSYSHFRIHLGMASI